MMRSNKRGSQLVEASISAPIAVITVLLLLRVFVFYLQIVNLGVSEHIIAMEEMDRYSGVGIKVYSHNAEISLIPGGLFNERLIKRLEVKAYFYNEDRIVRGKLVEEGME